MRDFAYFCLMVSGMGIITFWTGVLNPSERIIDFVGCALIGMLSGWMYYYFMNIYNRKDQ